MYNFNYSYNDYLKYIKQCPFSDEEINVFDLRRKGKSIIAISLELNMSEASVSRRIKSIADKIAKEN